MQSATELAGDMFTGYGTWKWLQLHGETGAHAVYRYLYAHPRPPMTLTDVVAGLAGGVISGPEAEATPRLPEPKGAVHSADIEYFMGNLATNTVYAWTDDDYRLSELMQTYYANFVKTGDPNGANTPRWPAANQGDQPQLMLLDVESGAEPDRQQARFEFLDYA